MAGSLNKVTLIGHLGAEPDIRAMQDGREIANLSIATTDSWKDKNTGERRDRTEWHRVIIFSDGLVKVVKNYLHKGSKVFIEGSLQTRKWEDKDGITRYSTEVVMQGFGSTLIMLDSRQNNDNGGNYGGNAGNSNGRYQNQQASPFEQSSSNAGFSPSPAPELDDEMPF